MKFKLPKYVSFSNGRFVYRPYIPLEIRGNISVDKYGRLKPPVRLGSLSDPEAFILRAYLKAKDELEFISNNKGTLFWLSKKYLSSKRFSRLKIETQKDYEQKLNKILSFPVSINHESSSFGDIYVANLNQVLLRNLLDSMLEDYEKRGYSGSSIVNGQFRVLSAMITFGLQYIDNLGILSNPCKGVELHKENIRERYVTDEEYFLQYNFALNHSVDYLPVFFEHAYLLAARSVEISDLKISSVSNDGYIVERRKGSKDTIILWSSRLRAVYSAALGLHSNRSVSSIYLIPSTSGKKLSASTLKSAMARLKSKMFSSGLGDIFWNLHDLKRKGISDAKDNRIAGHKTEQMRSRYNVVLEKFEAPG